MDFLNYIKAEWHSLFKLVQITLYDLGVLLTSSHLEKSLNLYINCILSENFGYRWVR